MSDYTEDEGDNGGSVDIADSGDNSFVADDDTDDGGQGTGVDDQSGEGDEDQDQDGDDGDDAGEQDDQGGYGFTGDAGQGTDYATDAQQGGGWLDQAKSWLGMGQDDQPLTYDHHEPDYTRQYMEQILPGQYVDKATTTDRDGETHIHATQWLSQDGTRTTTFADGEQSIHHPDGSVDTVKAKDGEWHHGDGSDSGYKPDNPQEDWGGMTDGN